MSTESNTSSGISSSTSSEDLKDRSKDTSKEHKSPNLYKIWFIIIIILFVVTLIVYVVILAIAYNRKTLFWGNYKDVDIPDSFQPLGEITPLTKSEQEDIQAAINKALNPPMS